MKQVHPIPPLFDQNSKVLILGSFPSVKSREQEFFYGHPQNRFWKVISKIFCETEPNTVDEKRKLILENNLALWDVIAECEIIGSSDSSIKNVIPNDLNIIFSKADIKKIFVNGKTAGRYYSKFIEPKVLQKAIVLSSTSPANASKTLENLVDEWSVIKDYL